MSDLPERIAAPKRIRRPLKLVLALVPLLLLGGAWGLAKAGVLPVGKWAGKNPAAGKAFVALGLAGSKKKAPVPTGAHSKAEAEPAVTEAAGPEPPAAPPPAPEVPPADPAPPAEEAAPADNPARVARILVTMDSVQVARLFTRMPDAEVAPLLLRMKARTAGEILAALPTPRAVALTRYLRRYPTNP